MFSASQIVPGGGGRKRKRSKRVFVKAKRSNVMRIPTEISKRNIIGTKQHAVLRFSERFQLDPGVGGTCATRVYSANGVYDPLIALGGHQPRGFDQLIVLYDHFVVTSSSIKVYFDNNSEASAMIAGVAVRDQASTSTDFRDYMEWGPKKITWLAETSSGINAKTVQYKVDPNKFLGRNDPLSDPDLKNSASSNPSEEAYWHIFCFPGNTGDASPVNAVVEIEYGGWFIEPKLPTVS